ncbi:MAG: DUF2341 domain-containing protein [Candidatus Omnitrophica bacterium]|nr:DUF2341 domain-containing protein [Candidatus Omnitrophota bacterium]
MELVRSAGFDSPVSVSTNTYNTKVWFADDSTNDSSITQLTGWGRDEPSDTPLVKPYNYSVGDKFEANDFMFDLYSQDASIYQGIKMDFNSDNRAGTAAKPYVLETENVNRDDDPYALTTYSGLPGLPNEHSIIDKEASVIHIDRFRDKSLISPKSVCANSISNRNNSEYDISWAANTGNDSEDDSVVKYTQDWEYKRPIILSPSTPEEDFQIRVELNTTNFNYSNVYGTNGEDIRFTDSQGNILRYWIEEWNSSDTSTIWVKVKNSGTDKIYIYYGNPNATSQSDGKNTFVFFDDFESYGDQADSELPSGWNNYSSGEVQLASDGGNRVLLKTANNDPHGGYIGIGAELHDFELIFLTNRINSAGGLQNRYSMGDVDANGYGPRIAGFGGALPIFAIERRTLGIGSNLVPTTPFTGSANTWYKVVFRKYSNNLESELYDMSGGLVASVSNTDANYNNFTHFYVHGGWEFWTDVIRVCKYSSSQPYAVLGDEQAIRYAGILKVGGFNSPQSISVNSSDGLHHGEVWVADTGDSCVVKLDKNGHKTITATVVGDYSPGATSIILSDISELDTGINISFNNHQEDAYRIEDFVFPLSWWDEDWIFRKPLTFNKFSLGEGLDDFPVMVKLTPSNFDYTKSTGADIRFIDADGITELPYEIEEWVDNDTSIIWVKVPNIPADNPTADSDYIWIYYGNPGAEDKQDTENVWDSHYLMVQHMKDGPSETILDSTSNSYDGTKRGTGEPVEIDAKIGKGQSFTWDGVSDDDYIQTATPVISGNITTYGGWIRWDAIAPDGSGYDVPLQQADAVDVGFEIYTWNNKVYAWDGTSSPGGYDISTGTWYQVYAVHTGTQFALYVNGARIGAWVNSAVTAPLENFVMGGGLPQNSYWFDGTIDEVRISDTDRSDSWIKAEYNSMIDNFIDYGDEEAIGVIIDLPLRNYVMDGSSVARELARIGGFTEPVAVAVDSILGDCWVIDDNDTVIWINGDIGNDIIPATAGYNINTDAGYHHIITGFNNPVSVSADPLSGNCWVACEGSIGSDSYIVQLDKDVPDGYTLNGNRHTKIFGFDSPNAVSIDPSTGECWVSDKGNAQVVRLSPEGHRYTGYIVDEVGLDTVILELDSVDTETRDTDLYQPLKISFGSFASEIKPVYEIVSVTPVGADNVEIKFKPELTQSISGGIRVNKELARVGGFSSPSDVSAFKGEDLGLGLHPWRLQVREFYVVGEDEFPNDSDDGWRDFPVNTPIHDATPQFRWKYIDIDGDYLPLDSYRIRIWTRDDGGNFVSDPVWDSDDSGGLTVDLGREIYPGQWIYTDWDNSVNTKENDSTGRYSTDYGSPDEDDCPDLSQIEDSDTDLGDRTYFVQLTVKNRINLSSDTYPLGDLPSSDTSIIAFTLDKTPPGSYRVCGTQVFVPATEDNNIKTDWDDVITPTTYLQTDNYYWDEVWVQWDGGDTEIVGNTSLWIPKKQVTLRVKVKDRNNENPPKAGEPERKGHDDSMEIPEDSTNCSGISLNAQYRYSRATSPEPREWSEWFDCEEVRLYDEEVIMSNNQGQRLLQGGVKDDFVWLYAKNVLFSDGDTNLIQFRVLDEGYMEVSKLAEDKDSADTAEVWIAPNMGYSHADTIVEELPIGNDITYQTSSNIYGYKLKIDSDIPQIILVEYPSNPYPHSFASFKWVAIDTTPCRYKWRLEYWSDSINDWDCVAGGTADDGEDPFTYSENTCNWQDGTPWDDGSFPPPVPDPTQKGTPGTSVSFEGLEVGRLYRFRVKAKDLDGVACDPIIVSRRVSNEAVWVWYVSPEVPNTIITSGPSGQVYGDVNFTWRGVGGMPPYEYNYRLGGLEGWQGWKDSTHPDYREKTYSGLSVGTYVFEVRAKDNNGSDPTPARRIFTVVDPSHPPYSQVSPKNIYKYFREIGE